MTSDGNFRGDQSSKAGNSGSQGDLDGSLASKVQVLAGGAIKPGSKLLLDYDFQPGPMGHHDYDLWDGLTDHLPWPPNATDSSSSDRFYGAGASPKRKRRLSRSALRARAAMKDSVGGGVSLGDSHSNLGEGKGSGSFMEPLYYEGHKAKLEALITLFQTHGDPLVGIHLNHDEINGVARDRRSLLSNLTNGQLLMRSINNLTAIITAKQPGILPIVYDDMFNPWQLYVGDQDNMQAEWYGREDYTLETAIEYLQDKSTVLLPWFYSWPDDVPSVKGSLHGASFPPATQKGHSHPAFEFKGEWNLGFRTVGCPFDDGALLLRMPSPCNWSRAAHSGVVVRPSDNMTQYWANELAGNRQLGLGFMDTDWSKTGNGIDYTAYVGWNNANKSLPVMWEKWGKRLK